MATEFLLILLFLAPAWGAVAQSGGIRGRITDGASGEGLAGVTVILVGSSKGTAAGTNGAFELTGLTPGEQTFRFSFIGY
ncbi:carboxypeptidase-like regulatory domain-containing protein [Hymenobacter elongatus]|uniref:carboxypeptidase-like regulatory domain-containing protein n=1 Tax=Hymenobacter elongatus TaxID=877208 RepID=UPI001FDA2C45|nr:carboxypeptidase-like regulatory domain-containing protein [Hymenobacter elongatus]